MVLLMSDTDEQATLVLPKPVDVLAALEEALDILSTEQLLPVLIGGIALSAYGIERYTKDVDLALSSVEIAKAHPLVQLKDVRPLRIGGLSFLTDVGVRVDLLDRHVDYGSLFQAAIEQARKSGPFTKVGKHKLAVVPIQFLMAMKLIADRPQDEADLNKLLQRKELDYPTARDIVYQYLGAFAAQRLDRLARIAGCKDAPPDYSPEDS
jgi:hypothetical protein